MTHADRPQRDATHLTHHLETHMFMHNHTRTTLAATAGITYQYLTNVLKGKQKLGTRATLLIGNALNEPDLARQLLNIQTTTEINRIKNLIDQKEN